jgi:hypothetical protein
MLEREANVKHVSQPDNSSLFYSKLIDSNGIGMALYSTGRPIELFEEHLSFQV